MKDLIIRNRLESFLRVLTGISALMLVGLFLASAIRRFSYPYELEELEGYMVFSLQRVMGGQTLYPPPNINFMPYMYPPGYFFASSFVARLFHTGPSFQALRLTSILSTLLSFLLLFAFAWRESRRFLPGLIAVGLYAGCYAATGQWFDLGRVDSLYVLLLLLALYATRFWPAPVAALFWLLTFTTKQSVLPVALVMLCFYFERRVRTLAGVAILAVGAALIVIIANRLTAGWFSFYVFKVPQAGTHLVPRAAVLYLPLDIFAPMGITCLIIFATFVLVQPDWRQPHIRFYLLTLLFVPLCGYIRMHTGATTNTEMPVYAVLALLGGLSFAWLDRWLIDVTLHETSKRLGRLGTIILLCAVSLQLWGGFYGPGDFVPTAEKKSSMEAVIQEAKQIKGDVYFPAHPYYGVIAGKTGYADTVSLGWVLAALDPVSRSKLQLQMSEILDSRQVLAVFSDSPNSIDSLDKELNISGSWVSRFPVRGNAPNADAATRPSFILSLCSLPSLDYKVVSPPLAPQGCSTSP